MTIGIVCFPSLGGSGVVASEEAMGLAARGHKVHLIARERPPRALPACDRLFFHPVELSEYPLFEYPLYTLGLASALIDLSRAHGLELIHVHYAVPHATSAYVARQALGASAPKLVTSLHGTDVTRVGVEPAYRSATTFAVGQSDAVIVPSAFLQREAHRLLELPASLPVEVIPNFVDTDRFVPKDADDTRVLRGLFGPDAGEGPLLIHVSNFRPVKRVVDVIEVLARVRQHLPARLVLVGEGPERSLAETRARQLGLEPWVAFTGRRNDFAQDLRHADAFVLPSQSESFGVAALEAMSSGVPVFGYRVGGLPELVTEEVGALVQPFDVDALAEAVLVTLQNPGAHQSMRAAARARAVTHFRAEPALDRYETLLRRVLEE